MPAIGHGGEYKLPAWIQTKLLGDAPFFGVLKLGWLDLEQEGPGFTVIVTAK